MSDVKILGKNSDFRVVKMLNDNTFQTVYSLSAYAVENVDHETPGKHYTRRHYQVRLFNATPQQQAWTFMGTLTLHLSGQSDTYILQQQTADSSSGNNQALILDWKGTIGQGDSISILVRRIDGSAINYNSKFYIMIS